MNIEWFAHWTVIPFFIQLVISSNFPNRDLNWFFIVNDFTRTASLKKIYQRQNVKFSPTGSEHPASSSGKGGGVAATCLQKIVETPTQPCGSYTFPFKQNMMNYENAVLIEEKILNKKFLFIIYYLKKICKKTFPPGTDLTHNTN